MRAGRGYRALVSLVAVGSLGAVALVGTATAGATPGSLSPAPGFSVPARSGVVDTSPADNRLLVTVAPGTSAEQAQAVAHLAGATIETRAGNTLILDPLTPSPGALHATSTQLEQIPGVQAVEPNGRVYATAAPNDPLYPDQYGLADTQPGGIRAESGWNDTRGSRDVVVGVLDSGIQADHPDLASNMWTNRTGILGCGYGTHGWDAFAHNCNPIDDAGHGTHVAGIVGATGNNGIGVTGVAQQVSLMSLRMLRPDGFGHVGGGEADAVEAINFALNAKAAGVNLRVLQASWGSTSYSVAVHDAITRANDAGVLFVTAAGNGDLAGNPINLDAPGNDLFPCEDTNTNVICVAASRSTGQLADFSNYGATAVDLAAPGFRIESTVPRGLVDKCDPLSDYCLFDGTSMATPMVSGAAVDILAAEPDLNVTDLKARILGSVSQQSSLVDKVATSGRLDVCKALPNCDGRPIIAPTVPTNVRARVRDGAVTLRWGAPNSNGNSFTVVSYDVQGPNGTTSLPLTATSYTLTGLPNNINSSVQIRAIGSGAAPSPWVAKTVRPYAGGYLVEGNGTVTPVGVGGKTPSPISGGPTFAFNAVRGIAIAPEGTGGYVVDLYGGIHRFRIGSSSPLPPAATGGPYWLGWDIVRGIAVSSKGGGYVIDGFGGLHPWGSGAGAPPAATHDGPYWSGFDIARGVVVNDNGTNGYVVDGYGGVHRFRIGSAGLPAAASGGPYWLGWNIVRGVTLVPGSGGGWVLDGFGGLHPFAAGGSAPAGPSSAPYWQGQDRARGVGL
jgi:Subtilisin-like serine proteases